MGSGKVEGGMKCVKWLMMGFNFLFFLVGMLLIICGALVMTKFKDYVLVLGSAFNAAPIVIIVVGVIIFIVAFFGCCGAWKENYCMVMAFASFMILILILQVCAAIAGFVMKGKVREIITEPLQTALKSYGKKKEYKSVFDSIQESLSCCGIEGPDDWKKDNMTIPLSCCKNVKLTQCTKDQAYKNGCLDEFDKWINSNVGIVAGVAVGVCFVQLIGILFACCLGRAIKKEYDVV